MGLLPIEKVREYESDTELFTIIVFCSALFVILVIGLAIYFF